MYLNSITYFRAIAVVFIVSSHCYGLADFSHETIIGITVHNLIGGGSFFFIFISGFLFHHVFYKEFNLKNFLVKKLKYVFLPYIILSSIPICYFVFVKNAANKNPLDFFTGQGEGWVQLYIIPFFKYFVSGAHVPPYWYIPFIMIIYAISPLYVAFIKLPIKKQLVLTMSLLVCSVLIHRPVLQFSLQYTFGLLHIFYFSPFYMLGIICSEKKGFIYSAVKGKEFFLLALSIIIVGIQVYLGHVGNYYRKSFEFLGVDLMMVQKVVFCFFFLTQLNHFENKKSDFLSSIATYSFGIYFIHYILIMVFTKIKIFYHFSFPSDSILIYCCIVISIFFLSFLVAYLVKKIFPKNSRYLIGS